MYESILNEDDELLVLLHQVAMPVQKEQQMCLLVVYSVYFDTFDES